jgi:hypothetical protein
MVDSLFGRVLTDAQRRSDLFQILIFKEPKHNGVVIFLAQPGHRAVQQRRDFGPGIGFGLVQQGLHVYLLFSVLAAALCSQGIGGGVLSCAA